MILIWCHLISQPEERKQVMPIRSTTKRKSTKIVRCLRQDQEHRHLRQKSNTLLGVRLGTRPARKHEANLVHEISNVVYDIEGRLIGCARETTKDVSQGIDTPPKRDDQAHVAERLLDSIGHTISRAGIP